MNITTLEQLAQDGVTIVLTHEMLTMNFHKPTQEGNKISVQAEILGRALTERAFLNILRKGLNHYEEFGRGDE